MKTINETFTDSEYAMLVMSKNGKTWHEFILTLLKGGRKNGKTRTR